MEISVELTFSPLQDDYESHIIDFIKRLRASDFTLIENPLSTQIYGPYDQLMPFLQEEIKKSLNQIGIGLFTIKIVKTDRSDYEPHF